jgi:hypothetical protein
MTELGDLCVIFKLVSGETVICQVISDTDKNMLIRDPFEVRIHSQITEAGVKATTYYADWFLTSKTRVHMIRKEHVMSAALPSKDTLETYLALVDNRDDTENDSHFNWEQQFNFDDTDPERN